MKNFRLSSLWLLVVFALLLQPANSWADNADTVVKVDKGDIVWSKSDAVAGKQIYFSSYKKSSDSWSAPVRVTNDAYRNGHPVIDAGTDNSKWLVWVAGADNSYMIRYSVEKNGSWSSAKTIPSPLRVNLAPSVVVDKSGVPWVAWSGNNGGQDEIYCSSYQDEAWTTPVQVNSTNQVPDILPEITLDAKGEPQVTWQGYRDGAYVQLQSTWDGEQWSAEKKVETSSSQSTSSASSTTSASSTASSTASSQKTVKSISPKNATQTNGSISNMPRFIDRPDKAFLRVYKSSVVK